MTSTSHHPPGGGAAAVLDGMRGQVAEVSRTLWAARPARGHPGRAGRPERGPRRRQAPTSGHRPAHHVVHWIDGGPTSLANLLLLCGHHHRLVHSGPWRVQVDPSGRAEFPRPGATRERLISPRPPPRE